MDSTLGVSFPFDTGAVSQYQGWPFGDFFQLGDQFFGLASNAAFLLGGSDDAGESITWDEIGPQVDAGSDQYKRMRCVTVLGPGGEDMAVQVRTEQMPEGEWKDTLAQGGNRFMVGRDNVGREMQFRVSGTGPVEMIGVTIQALNLGLRQRG